MGISSENQPIKRHKTAAAPLKEGIQVRNAGIVILNNYIPMLFERLHFLENRNFTNVENQKKAVQYLYYVVTGFTETEEIYLPLNKVLCGLSVSDSVPDTIEISETDKTLMQELLKAVISHWPDIGSTSIDGFRGNWLVRDGILVELADRWELTVEKRAYDILISRSPFSFSVIKYPWMNKPLYVNWPY